MECEYIKINNQNCKYKAIHTFYDYDLNLNKHYCTRHFNKFNTSTNTGNSKVNKEEDILEKIDTTNLIVNTGNSNNNISIILYKNITKNTFIKYQDLLKDNANTSISTSIGNKNMLHYEYMLLTQIFTNHINIIKYKDYKIQKHKNIVLQLEYIPVSYEELKNQKLTYHHIKNIGLQLINVMKYIHSKKYLYINLNPSNLRFAIEKTDTDIHITVKIINFNSCIKYINNNSQFYNNDKILEKQGDIHYSSRNINLGYRGVRLDDIESILYILLDLNNNINFIKIKTLKQIGRIINIKNNIFKNKILISDTNQDNVDYLNNFINLLNEVIIYNDLNKDLSNRSINYKKFIQIFS